MACNEGNDPADFEPGAPDPEDDPSVPDMSIIDGIVVSDGAGGRKAQFAVVLSNANYTDVVTARFDTANGTATAPGMYTARVNQTVSFPVGTTAAIVEVVVLNPSNVEGNKYFDVVLSSPTHASLSDSSGRVQVQYTGGTNPPTCDDNPSLPGCEPDDPLVQPAYRGWPRPGVVYDEFEDKAYTYSCTAVACASVMAALIYRKRGVNVASPTVNGQPYGTPVGVNGDQGLDWKKLYRDAGGCTRCLGSSPPGCTGGCNGEQPTTMLRWMRDTGMRETATGLFHKARFTEIDRSQSMTEIIKDIKRAIYANGALYLMSPWYSDRSEGEPGWNRCFSCNDFVLQNPSADGRYGRNNSPDCDNLKGMTSASFGHTWALTGWDNNYKQTGGAFELLHGGGRRWGDDGRCWLPYSWLANSGKWHYWRLEYTGPL